jgi:integrase
LQFPSVSLALNEVKARKPKKITRGGQAVRISKRAQTKDGNEYVSWQLFWREDGKQRSTSRATQEEADALADEIAVRLAKGEIRQRILTGLELVDYEKALEICQQAGASIVEAARLLKATRRPPVSKTVAEVRTEFLASKATRAKRSRESLSNDTKPFVDQYGEMPILDLHVGELSKWLTDMPVKPRTKRNRFSNLRTMFRWARRMGYLPDTETEIERVDNAIWAEESREDWVDDDDRLEDIRLLTPTQLQKLFDSIPERLIPALALCAFQGLRRSEALRLHWRMVKTKNIEIPKIIARRQKVRRTPPYQKACAAWLEQYRQSEGLIIPHADRFTQLTTIAKKIGIDPWPQNTLRHSFISYRLALIRDEAEVAWEAGTSVEKIHSNYDEKATKEDAKKWFAVLPKK